MNQVTRLEQRVAELEAEIARLGGTPPLLPEGEYRVEIADLETKNSLRGRRYISVEAKVIGDEFDRKVWINVVEGGVWRVFVRHDSHADHQIPRVIRILEL